MKYLKETHIMLCLYVWHYSIDKQIMFHLDLDLVVKENTIEIKMISITVLK